MTLRVLEFLAGLLLSVATLRDVFYTAVVPGSTRGLLKVSRTLVHIALPVWKHVQRRGIGVNFAPIVLVGSFAIWMLLLLLGFGLMTHALRDSFEPPLSGFGHALYVAGGSMTTIGFGRTEALGLARGLAVAAGMCGLAVMTLAVTYLLEVQSNIAHRDTGVLLLTTAAGQPPSALALLERYAALRYRHEVEEVLRDGRNWCSTVLQSHTSHPWLVYFRSVGTGSGWPAALGTLMDVALIAEHIIDEPSLLGPAVLTRDAAHRVGRDLAALVSAAPAHESTSSEEAETLIARLTAAGFRLRADRDPLRFARTRDEHAAPVRALANHLGMPSAPLVQAGPRPDQLAGP